MNHNQLIQEGAEWLYKKAPSLYKGKFILTEFKSYTYNIPDVFSFRSGSSTLLEVKVDKKDFYQDFNKKNTVIGNYRFYLTLPNIINENELPLNWGLLIYDNDEIIIKKHPLKVESDYYHENAILYSLLRKNIKPGIFGKI